MPVGTEPRTDLFLRTIWGDSAVDPEKDTYVYVAFGTRNAQRKIVAWDRQFYVWPKDESAIIADIERRKADEEVYYCPSLLHSRDAHKDAALGSRVYWVDFDGNVPNDLKGVPSPTIRVQTSDGHEHWYWRTDGFSSPDVTEERNRSFVHLFDADKSGWDATQVLRPPGTFNHKRKALVELVEYSDVALPVGLFSGLPTPPPVEELYIAEVESLPNVTEIVFRYKFPPHVYKLFSSAVAGPTGGDEGQRSTKLMSLAFALAEVGLTNEEIVSMLNNCCERWGKFVGRADKITQLTKIVAIARRKYPFKYDVEEEAQPLVPMGFKTLLATEVHLEWIWNGWLQEGGYMLFTGPPGVGKTQLSLYVGACFALGKDTLGRHVTKPRRVAFLSLEMGLTDLKEFMLLLAAAFTPEEQEILQQNLLILPLGEPLYMNRDDTKRQVEQMVEDYKIDGLIIDSLSSTVEGELKDEATVKALMDWNDHLRQKFRCFTWIIHHHRKGNSTNKKPNKLDDIYGPYLLTARATSVFCLWPTEVQNAIEVRPLKVRLSPKPDPFYIRRDSNLHFDKVSTAAVSMVTPASTSSEDGPTIVVVDEPIAPDRSKFQI